MARRSRATTFQGHGPGLIVDTYIEIPEKLLGMSSYISGRRGAWLEAVVEGVRVQVVANLGASRSIGPSFRGRLLTQDAAELRSQHPGARAQERGAYIVPKKKALRWVTDDGQVVFSRKPVRVPAKHYLQRALRRKRAIAVAALEAVMPEFDRE